MASHSQGSPSPPPPLDTALLPAKRKIACLACRTIKLRCLFAGPDAAPLDPCRRCKRLDIACIYQPKRRPVKPSSTTQASSATTNSADTGKLVVVDGGGEDNLLESRRTRSPFDAVDSIHHPYTQQMYPQQQQQSGQPRMSYGINQSDGYPEHPSKRRRIPGPGQPGEGYGEFESSFTGPAAGERADAYGYEGYGVYGGSLGRQVVPHFPAGHSGADRPGTGASDINPHHNNPGTEIDQKAGLLADSGNPGFALDPAFSTTRSREPATSYGSNDPQRQEHQQQQEQRDWTAMYGNVGAVQQNQIHLSQPPFQSVQALPSQTAAHRGSIQNARSSVSGPSGQHHNLHVPDHGNLPPGHATNQEAQAAAAVMTPGSHEGSVGTAGTAPGTAGTISSAGGMAGGGGGGAAGHYRPTTGTSQRSTSRPKGKILYTQPLSISPSSMGTGGMGGSGFHTSSERSTRHVGGEHTHGHQPPGGGGGGQHGYSNLAPGHPPHQPQHTPLQVAHPQSAPAYREYGSYLSYERDVHDVGAGPIAPSSDSGSEGDANKAMQVDTLDGVRRVKGEHGESSYGPDEGASAQDDALAEHGAMRNSMALTSILDDMKKDLRAPTTSSERDRHHHQHHHHQHHHHHQQQQQHIQYSNTEGKIERETSQQSQSIQPHSADYVTQEGPTGADPGREMDSGERYNAMDIAERERKLASVLDIGSGGIGGGGPISINLDLQSTNGNPGTNPSHPRASEKGQSGQHLMVPPQQHHHSQQPSALVSPHTKRNIRGRVGIVDDENRMRQREREDQRLERERMEGMEDPVTLGILDQDDVTFLFECFHDKFNAYIAILDPALHTPSYVLKTCSILHTAVCTVTAQTYAPEQYKVLLKRVNFMLGKAFERGDQHIGIVQALSILSCWKEPHDKGGWLRLGYAIRMGYELGLDQPPQRPLPKDKLKAFEVLNRERTWFQLAAFDRSMHSIFGRRQRMIRTETQHWIEDWITDHPEVYCYADGMLAASYPTGEMIINLRQSTPSYMEDDVGFRVMLHRTRTDIASWRERWFGEQPLAFLHPISAAIIGFYAVASDWEVADFCYRNVPKSRIPEHLADATSKAMKLLRYIVTDLAPGEIMVFAPDVITVRAARSAVFLARLIPQLDPTVVEEIYNIFRDVVRECRRHSRGQNTTYHLAKFFASLIKISSVGPTRSASRIQTPDEDAQEPQGTALSGEALTAKLNEAAEGPSGNQDPVPQDFFQNDESLFVFDDSVDPLSIDALLQESQDWFSADLMAQINSDGGWNPLPTFPLPDFQML